MSNKHIGYGKATGKIILMGEHSVVYGKPAIAFPFDATSIVTTVSPCKKLMIDCHYFIGDVVNLPIHLTNVREVIYQTLAYLDKKDTPLKLVITSSIPPERGMGSSAAVASSIVRALFDYFNQTVSSERLLELVNHSEKIAHGNPSGIDAAATSGNQPLFFIKGELLEPFSMNVSKAYLIVADTGIKGQTRAAVSDVAMLFKKDEKTTSRHIDELGYLTKQAKQAILTDDIYLLGKSMYQAHAELQALTVSNQQLDCLVETARTQGALGAKLTGGGRGGCMIVLCNAKESARDIATALENNGAKKTWIQSLEVKK